MTGMRNRWSHAQFRLPVQCLDGALIMPFLCVSQLRLQGPVIRPCLMTGIGQSAVLMIGPLFPPAIQFAIKIPFAGFAAR